MEIPKMGGMRGFPKSKMITVQIPAGNGNPQISLGEQSDLRYARILGLETFTSTDLATSIPDNIPLISDAQLKLISLVLETNDADDWQVTDPNSNSNPNNTGRFRTTSQNIKWQPLATFHRVQNSAAAPFVRQLFEFNNIFITFDKSFIVMPTPINPGGSAIAVAFQVYYTFRSIYGKMISRT